MKVRKPHNLITEYWDDTEFFLQEAEKMETERMSSQYPEVYNKRNLRYCILSSFLFLEAFINGEYFTQMNYVGQIKDLNISQKTNLNNALKIPFEDKWSKWIIDFSKDKKFNFGNVNAFKNIKRLKIWRNQLSHYKIHELYEVAHEIQTIKTARFAVRTATEAVRWYYEKTNFDVPDWIVRDIFKEPVKI